MLTRPTLAKPTKAVLIVIAALAAVLAFSTYLLFSWDSLPQLLETAIEKGLAEVGIQVEIGSIRAGFGSSLRLGEVVLELPEGQSRLLLPEVRVHFSWLSLLRNLTNPVAALTEIHLIRPTGSFDLAVADLLGATGRERSTPGLSAITVRVVEGSFEVGNFRPELNEQLAELLAAAGLDLSTGRLALADVSFELRTGNDGQVGLRGNLAVREAVFSRLQLQGRYEPTGRWQAALAVDNVDLTHFTALAGQYQDQFALTNGAASATLYLSGGPEQTAPTWLADLWLHRLNGSLVDWELPVRNLQGGLRVSPQRIDVLGLRAHVDGELIESAGVIHLNERIALDLLLTANRLNLGDHQHLWKKLIPEEALESLSGQASVNLMLTGNLDAPLLAGTLRLTGLAAELSAPTEITVSDLSGVISFAGDEIWTDRIFLRLAGQPVSLHGQVLLGPDPYFNFVVATERLGLDRVVAWLDQRGLGKVIPGFLRSRQTAPLKGDLSLSGTVLGTLQAPLVAGQISLTNGQVAGVPVAALTADFDYAVRSFNFRNIKLTLEHGQAVQGHASISQNGGRWGYSGIFRYTDLAPGWLAKYLPALPPGFGQVGGRASGEFVVEGGFAGAPHLLSGSLRLVEPQWAAGLFEAITADWTWQDGVLAVRYLEALSDLGSLSLTGSYDWAARTIDGQVFGHELSLKAIARRLTAAGVAVPYLYPVDGQVSVRARISGSSANPQITGSVVVTDPAWSQEHFDLFTTAFSYRDQVLAIEKAELIQGLARLVITGQVNKVLTEPQLFLKAELVDTDAAKLQKLLGTDWPVAGLINAKLDITGKWPNPQVRGPITLADGQLMEIPLDEVKGTLLYRQGLVEALNVAATLAGTSVRGDGRYQEGRIEAAFDVANLRLADLQLLGLPVDTLEGTADFSGVLTGSLANLQLNGQIAARDVAYQGRQVKEVNGLIGYESAARTVTLNSLRFYQGQTSAQVTGEVRVAKEPVYDLSVRLAGGNLVDLAGFLPQLTLPEVVGGFSGQFHLAGVGSKVNGRGTLRLSKLGYLGLSYDGQADVAYQDGVIRIHNATLWDNRGEIRLSGAYQLGGEFSLSATGKQVNIAPIADAIRPGLAVTGKADLTAAFSGTPQNPRGQVRFTINDGEVAGVAFDDFGGDLDIDSGGIYLSDVTVVTGANKTVVQGRIPWPGRPSELDLRIQMADESLSLLSVFAGMPLDVSGQGRIDLTVTGPLDKPAVNGVVDLADLRFSLPGVLPGRFEQVAAKIDFQGTRAVIRKAEGLYNGGRFSLDGSIVFNSLADANLDLNLTGRRLGFELSMMRAKADADLTITGPLSAPLIKGEAVLADAVFFFAQGRARSSGQRSTSPVRLDIHVTNSNDVRILVSDIVDVRAIGEVTLGGTISELTLAGRAEATRGTLTYADALFTVTSATAHFTPLNGVIPNLVLQAETRVPDAVIQLAITGPTDDLQLALSSNPPMTEQEIVSRLGLPGRLSQLVQGAREGGWEEELIRLFDDQLSAQVMGGLESVIREALQLDEFRIRRAFSEENIQLQFGKYLVDNLYVTYTRTLDTEDPLEYLGFEYRIKPNIILNNSISSDGDVRLGIETKLWF